MYEPFFGMERRPFSATPDPGCYFSSNELQAVIDELTLCVDRGQGIGLLTAAAGMGKTLFCQRLAADLRQRKPSDSLFECVSLGNSNYPTRRSLLQAILFEMGDEYSRRDEPELRLDLRSRLLSLRPQRQALVLIVDEAHLFADELLEEIRLLSDSADNGSPLVRIILSGQHELEERLTDRAFDALNQRVSNHVFLESLTISESVDYIRHRLAWAGCDIESVFSEEAISVITRASGGVPRCLNQLADHSLLLAFACDQKPVSEHTVREALDDLKQLPLHWNDVSDGTAIVGYQDDDPPLDDLSLDDLPPPESEVARHAASAVKENASADTTSIAKSLFETVHGSAGLVITEVPSNDLHDDDDDGGGIVESFRAGTPTPAVATPQVAESLHDDGIEFDFSRDSVGEAASQSQLEASQSLSDLSVVENDPETSNDDSVDAFASDKDLATSCDDKVVAAEFQDAEIETPIESIIHGTVEGDVDTPITAVFEFSCDASDGGDESIQSDRDDDSNQIESCDQGDESNPFESANAEETLIQTLSPTVTEPSFATEASSGDTPTDELSGSPDIESKIGVEVTSHSFELEGFGPPEEWQSEPDESVTSEAADTSELQADSESISEHNPDETDVEEESSEDVDFIVAKSDAPDSAVIEFAFDDDPVDETGDEHTIEAAAVTGDPFETELPVAKAEPDEEVTGSDEEIAFESSGNEEQPAATRSDCVESVFEEELIFDPYAALQEPETAGIVWDLSHFASSPIESSIEQSNIETVESRDVDGGPGDSNETPIEAESFTDMDSADGDTVCKLALETEHVEEHWEGESALESADDVIDDVPVESLQSDVDSFVDSNELISDEDDSESIEDEAAHDDSDSVNQESGDNFQHEDFSQTEFAQSEHDIVVPAEARQPCPDRIVDSILPLLQELDEDLETVVGRDYFGRSVFDIEAELIQTIEHGSSEVEDEIGVTTLDICLDTQSALQESAAALRETETGEPEISDIHDELDDRSDNTFDIVQPEPQQHRKQPLSEQDTLFREPRNETSSSDKSAKSEQPKSEKPFSSLFSDLRRRNA